MARQEFDTVDVLRLEVETDPTGLVNLVQNPSGELGGWGWITTIAGSKIDGGTALTYTGVAGASFFTTEEVPVAAGQYAAARWNAVSGTTGYFFRARFEWINSAGAVISSSTQTGYLARNSGVGNLGAQLAPLGTVWARLRFDIYSNNTGTNPAGAHTFTFKEVTVGKAATSGALGQSRANLVPNPSFETDTKGWQVVGDCAIAKSSALAYIGSSSLRYTHTSATVGSSFRTLSKKRGIPVVGGQLYALQCRMRAAATSRDFAVLAQWYDSDGADLGGAGTHGISVPGSWTLYTNTVTAPANAAYLSIVISSASKPAVGEVHYFDAFMVEQASTAGAYFDAATPDASGWDYGPNSWPPVVTNRTNLVPNPAPGSTMGYTPGPDTALTFNAPGGTLLVEPQAGTSDTFASVGGDIGGLRLGMVAGKTYTVSAELVSSVHVGGYPGRTDAIVVFHRIGAGSYTTLATPAGVGRKYLTFTLPAGTTEAFIRLYHGGSKGGVGDPSAYSEWRKVLLEETTENRAYFDGSNSDAADFTVASGRAWTGTVNNSTSVQTDTFTLPYATAVNSNLGYLDPVQYLNVIGESHELREVRQALQVGELTATIVSRALDPADSALIRPGRRARLRALVNGVWDELITGKLIKANVDYELKDPSIPDEKRAIITVNLVDAGQPLAQAKRPQGVSTIAELPFVLEGAGVPWNVNGSGNQVATATPTTFNDNASALNQVALTRDTRSGYAWVSRRGVVNAWDAASLPSGAPLVLDEATYSGLKVTYDTDDCINIVSVTVQSLGVDGTTTETTYGPYEDAASIEKNGRFLKEFTVTGLTKPQVDTFAAAVIAANKEPARRVQSVTLPLNTLARVNAHALIDLYAEVQVVNGEVSLSDVLRVTGIEHSIQTKKWLLTLTFATDGAVASPLFQPPVQSDASPDVGVIEWFAGPVAKIPATKLLCDGSSKAVAAYPYLFAVIGYTFGGSGASFNVPNLVDKFPIGAGTKALGTSGGSPTKTIADTNMPNTPVGFASSPSGATHGSIGINTSDNNGNGRRVFAGTADIVTFPPPRILGGGQPLDVMNPWLALTPVIRAV